MDDTTYMKPLPEPGPETAPFWQAMHAGQLKLQACADCGKVRHYPRPVCPECYSMQAKWVESPGRGKVHSWTIAHHPFHPGFKGELPYVLVTVDLDEGVRMNAQLRGGGDGLRIGMPVRIAFEGATKDLTLPVFVRA